MLTETSPLPYLATDSAFDFSKAVKALQSGSDVGQVARRLLKELTTEERLSLLDGDVTFWKGLRGILCDRYNRFPFVMGEVSRLGVPGIRFTDGPRGIVMGNSTAFPVAMARGATWDCELEEEVGHAIGREGRAQGANFFAGVCINLPRHPAWGRAQETYGEDPILLGNFGVALTRGVRGQLMACVKHFALNSMENARFSVDVQADEQALHEVYLPHFKRVIEEGAEAVMSSYNSVNGQWAGESRQLLTEILRDEWGFEGFTISDFIFGLRDAVSSVENGLDLEAPFAQQRAMHLGRALQEGRLQPDVVDKACLRLLSKQIEYAARMSIVPPVDPDVVLGKQHKALAHTVAARSMVLLENRDVENKAVLPLGPDVSRGRMAVIGRLANAANTGDRGSSAVFCPEVISPYQGLKESLPDAVVELDDSDDPTRAAMMAAKSDTVVVVVGYDAGDEGEYVVPSLQQNPELATLFPAPANAEEQDIAARLQGSEAAAFGSGEGSDALQAGDGGDRVSLRLRTRDVEIIRAAAQANRRTVVAVVTAGAVIMEEWRHLPAAILVSWYAGSQGGRALADVLLGRSDASGRLPFSIPEKEEHLPFFDKNATKITYDCWFGQRLLDRMGVKAAYPLGFGLSYARFALTSLAVNAANIVDGEQLEVTAVASNQSERSGRYVAQVYGKPATGAHTRVLLGFQPVDVPAGESREVRIQASVRPLQRRLNGCFSLVTGQVDIEVGAYAGDPMSLKSRFNFPSSRL